MCAEYTAQFSRTIRQRSEENQSAIALLHSAKLYSNAIAILRFELDSMIRVIYLLSIQCESRRNSLMGQTNRGEKWTKESNEKRITDAEMVEVAYNHCEWVRLVYKCGCAFVHLSNLHDWKTVDLMQLDLIEAEISKVDIILYVNQYHNADLNEDSNFETVMQYLVQIFAKIKANLEGYLGKLEENKSL